MMLDSPLIVMKVKIIGDQKVIMAIINRYLKTQKVDCIDPGDSGVVMDLGDLKNPLN